MVSTWITICSYHHRPCCRPINHVGECVTPSDLNDHHRSHQFLGPGCLCSLMDMDQPPFVECALYQSTASCFSGKYVASCAQDICGYFGRIIASQIMCQVSNLFNIIFDHTPRVGNRDAEILVWRDGPEVSVTFGLCITS